MKGLYFDDIHSYEDLNLILSSVSIPPATAKTTYVDIPGGDGSVDLTEALGEVKYKNRECSFTFTVFPYEDIEEKKTYISNLLNGKRCNITLDKDPDYYWTGRCTVKSYSSDKNIHQITVAASVAPYKLKKTETVVTVPAGTNVARTLANGRKTVVPTVITTVETQITFSGNTLNVNAGTHVILNLELKQGNNPITVTSAQPVIFKYREGDL